MKRRQFIALTGASTATVLAGCTGADESERDPDEEVEPTYSYNKEYFELEMVAVSRNAPDAVGVTMGIASNQFSGTAVPIEVKLLDSDGNTVFHKPEYAYEIDGGDEETETCWFKGVPEEKFHMDLYPKVRFRDEPPKSQ